MEKHRHKMDSKMNHWEKEFQQKGIIENEGSLLAFIKTLSDEKDKDKISNLLSIAGLSRLNKVKQDSLGLAWIRKAFEINPNNSLAAEMIERLDWKNRQKFLSVLSFPPLRETDHKQAKLQAVEQIQDICRYFLDQAEEEKDKLEKIKEKLTNLEFKELYSILLNLLVMAQEEVILLLKASEDYKQSVVGVFYHSSYYADMKKILERIDEIKKNWQQLFLEDIHNEAEIAASPIEELDKLVGLEKVKVRVKDFYRYLKYQNERKALGYQLKDELSLDMIITGNPGTGKSTIARLLAKIYYDLGALTKESIVEVDRSQLVGAFVGQTEENVRSAVQRALGGVLFIDEAYSLKRQGQTGNDYGQTVIDTLVSLMTGTEFGGKFAVIMAGYPDEMRQFLDANPGLRSRFPQSNHIHLPDYTNTELILIADKLSMDNDYVLTDEAKQELEKRIEMERVDDTFGNARAVKNIVLDAIFKKGAQNTDEHSILDYSLLDRMDFEIIEHDQTVDPLKQLENLIGLEEVKNEVKMLTSFVKMQQIRRNKGLPVVPIQLHSVFIGNPGTGKTTVAKIYAELLKECGFLKRGHLIVASRADFVAGYVGQTAIKTKKKIKEALGGALFIDEAYSLLSQTQGDFGKEVIDTLVDEMTKHNENLVVILAGYPKEMEALLQSNPGLKSRFKKFLHFNDYSLPELLQIMINYASHFQYKLSDEAIDFINSEINTIEINGNGRFATNLIDETIQSQAMRLLENENRANLLEHVSFLEKMDVQSALERMGKGE